jgi:predicted  nucleic acid-binding Zn-ribbon protein
LYPCLSFSGICSAIYNLIVWPITIAAVETEIAEYREALEETSEALNAIVESIDSIEKTLKVANKKLEEEVSLVITWQAKAQSTDRTLQRWSVDQLQQKQGLQKLVLKSLTK